MKLDLTKPIRHTSAFKHCKATYVGPACGRHVVRFLSPDGVVYFREYLENGTLPEFPNDPIPQIENVPATHTRWLVLFSTKFFPNDVRIAVYCTPVDKSALAVYDKVYAIKEITVTEGEGL